MGKKLKHWPFNDYCMHHTQANNTLSKYGIWHPYNGLSQVRAFLDGIHNPQTNGVTSHVMFNTDTKGDSGQAIISFRDTIKALNLLSSRRQQ